jgi:hypothetical protein
MRHVAIAPLLQNAFSGVGRKDRERLRRAHKQAAKRKGAIRQRYIDARGVAKWSPLKNRLTAILGNKCWYTETELIGAALAIDHYRPVRDYWYLAFTPENFRVSCDFANSPKRNELYKRMGGKGDRFPLLAPGVRAKRAYQLKAERPVILDPCVEADCSIIAFQSDGRPVIHPAFAGDADAVFRLEESKVLLNLDHPDFNSKREQLYFDIRDDVETYEDLLLQSRKRGTIKTRMKRRLSDKAPFSVAARHYLQLHRHLDWVEELLAGK